MSFGETIAAAYAVEGPAVELGRGVHEGRLSPEAVVRLPMRMLNRHGPIAGATGTGKTRTLQLIAEQLSAAGVAVFAADYKGDLSGMAEPGPSEGPAAARMAELGLPYEPAAFPVDFLSLGGIGPGVPVRATVTDFGPQLLAKVLGANETQESSLALVFRFSDERGLPLVDLADLRALLTYLESKEGKADLTGTGGVSRPTIGVLLRSLVQLEDGGGNEFFGEPQFEISDLLRTAPDGRGVVSSLEPAAVQDRPKLFSTVLMWLLAELFEQLPEVGDLEELLTSLGIGEAAVTVLSERGVPTPVVHTRLVGPRSKMEPAADVDAAAQASPLYAKYAQRLERESAHELLASRVEKAAEEAREPRAPRRSGRKPKPPSDPLRDFLGSRQGKRLQREVVRGVFGMLRKRL